MNLLFFTQFAEKPEERGLQGAFVQDLGRSQVSATSEGTNQQHEWEPQVLTNQRRTNMEQEVWLTGTFFCVTYSN